MKIGFTGTQKNMTIGQVWTVSELFRKYHPSEFHHGDCIGADLEAHSIARYFRDEETLGCKIKVHPPTIKKKRAFCEGADEVFPEKPYLERNMDIVDSTDLLIACPKTMNEELRSGTWQTIRYARRRTHWLVIVWCDGTTQEEYARG